MEKDTSGQIGEMTTLLNKFNVSEISFEHYNCELSVTRSQWFDSQWFDSQCFDPQLFDLQWLRQKHLSDFTTEFANQAGLSTLDILWVQFGECLICFYSYLSTKVTPCVWQDNKRELIFLLQDIGSCSIKTPYNSTPLEVNKCFSRFF